VHHDVEEAGGDLPVFGEAGCEFIRKRAELVPVDATDEGGLIDQRGEFVGCGKKR